MIDLMSMTYAEKSALWAYYGKTEMSSVCAQLLLLHNTGDKKQHMFNGPSTCQAVVNVANILVEFGEYSLVDVVLGHAKERFPNEPCNKVHMYPQIDGNLKRHVLMNIYVIFITLSDMDVKRTTLRIHATN